MVVTRLEAVVEEVKENKFKAILVVQRPFLLFSALFGTGCRQMGAVTAAKGLPPAPRLTRALHLATAIPGPPSELRGGLGGSSRAVTSTGP